MTNRVLTKIYLDIPGCDQCPKVRTEKIGGCGIDYFCSLTGEKSMSYIEWDSEKKPVPDWCPLRAKL